MFTTIMLALAAVQAFAAYVFHVRGQIRITAIASLACVLTIIVAITTP